MGTPYERTFRVTVAQNNDIHALDYPGRCDLNRITIMREGNGAIAVDVYNRLFTTATVSVVKIVNNGDDKCRIYLARGSELPVHLNDLLTVASSSVTGYNVATHRVIGFGQELIAQSVSGIEQVAEIELNYIDTSEAYSADGAGGTVKLAIPSSEQMLYQVLAQITGTNSVVAFPTSQGETICYVNRDPIGGRNIGVNRKIYLKFSAAATYQVTINSTTGVD